MIRAILTLPNRSYLTLIALTLLPACAGTAKQANADSAPILIDEPEATSAEWLFATKGSSGSRAAECKQVALALQEETACGGALCSHGVALANDWLKVCTKVQSGDVAQVKGRLSKIQARQTEAKAPCELEAQKFIDHGCTSSETCATATQEWATRCGEEYGTPLVMKMLEREVRRVGQDSAPKLDTRSCEKLFASVTLSTACANDFDCTEKATAVEKYRARCETRGLALPLKKALRLGRVLVAAGRVPGPIAVKSDEISKSEAGLVTLDRKGIVFGFSEGPAADIVAFSKTLRESDHVQEVRLARLFVGENAQPELRFGTLPVNDERSFYRQFPSLRLEGQTEALDSLLEPEAIAAVSEAATKPASLSVALTQLFKGLKYPQLVARSTRLKQEFGAFDSRLVPIFSALGEAKARWLKGMRKQPARVAATRRSIDLPLADVGSSGELQLGAGTPAVLIELGPLFPESVNAYLKPLLKAVKDVKAIPFSEESEAELTTLVQKTAERCAAARQAAKAQEQAVLDCRFRIKTCQDADRDSLLEKLEENVTQIAQAQKDLQLAFVAVKAAAREDLADARTTCLSE